MKIGEKEITLGRLTRKIENSFTEKLLGGVERTEDGEVIENLNNLTVVNKANDYLVSAMTGLTQEEIDDLLPEEFSEILKEIEKLKNKAPKKAQ